jgi:hypothetical protein
MTWSGWEEAILHVLLIYLPDGVKMFQGGRVMAKEPLYRPPTKVVYKIFRGKAENLGHNAECILRLGLKEGYQRLECLVT